MQLVAKFIIHLHWTIIIYRVVPHEPTRRGPRFRGGLQRAGGVQAGGAGAAGMKGGGQGTTGAADTCSAIGVYDRRGERAQRVVSSAESGLGLRDISCYSFYHECRDRRGRPVQGHSARAVQGPEHRVYMYKRVHREVQFTSFS